MYIERTIEKLHLGMSLTKMTQLIPAPAELSATCLQVILM